MAFTVELQVDSAVLESLLIEPVSEACLPQEGHAAVFEHAGSLSRLAVFPAAQLDLHRIDAPLSKQVRQQQARRAGTDNAYLSTGAHQPLRRRLERVGRDVPAD